MSDRYAEFERESSILQLAYEKTDRDGIFAWMIIQAMQDDFADLKLHFPEWVIQYLQESAGRLLGRHHDDHRLSDQVMKDLELKPRTLRIIRKIRQYNHLTEQVKSRLEQGQSLRDALLEVADQIQVSPSTVKRAFYGQW